MPALGDVGNLISMLSQDLHSGEVLVAFQNGGESVAGAGSVPVHVVELRCVACALLSGKLAWGQNFSSRRVGQDRDHGLHKD